LGGVVSLARLRSDEARHIEVRDLLTPIYGWFTEGFSMSDLKEAKALLDGKVRNRRSADLERIPPQRRLRADSDRSRDRNRTTRFDP
jgi:hypothetical protein